MKSDADSAVRFSSPAGTLGISADGTGLTGIFLCPGRLPDGLREQETPLLREAEKQLGEYFAGTRRKFHLPLSLRGTPFQLAVWAALQAIPFGETRSYGQLAAMIGRPRACRAVGMANHANPVMIIVPCHRVIGADGSLTGYGGGLEMKRFLLELEQKEDNRS